jgi:nucleotide-binding universal stress UspA family protein
MAFEDILLHIDSYPEPTSPAAVEQVVRLVTGLGGKLSALAVRVRFPLESNRVADLLIGLGGMIKEEEARSHDACRQSLDHFTATAKAAGVFQEAVLDVTDVYTFAEHVALRARTRDFSIVPLARNHEGQQEVAQAAIFSSGRPVLIFQSDKGPFAAGSFRKVVVGWDGGQCAARAMAEALPILAQARQVRVLSILNEKPIGKTPTAAEAVRHLAAHGIAATIDEVDAAGRPIGAVLDEYLAAQAPDLLVMGAYGHSRVREFILGGATRHMMSHPHVPVFMAH